MYHNICFTFNVLDIIQNNILILIYSILIIINNRLIIILLTVILQPASAREVCNRELIITANREVTLIGPNEANKPAGWNQCNIGCKMKSKKKTGR